MWWRSLSGTAKTKTPTRILVVVAVFGDPSILHGGFSYHQWISCSPFVGYLVVVFVILILLFDSDVYVLRCSAVLLSWCPHTRARIPFLPPPCSAVVVLAATHFYSPQYIIYGLNIVVEKPEWDSQDQNPHQKTSSSSCLRGSIHPTWWF